MKKFEPIQSKDGMLILKVYKPSDNICKVLDKIDEYLLTFGTEYRIVNFGLSKYPTDASCIDFLTNVPWNMHIDSL